MGFMRLIGVWRGEVGRAQGEELTLEAQAFGAVIAAAQADHIVAEAAQEFPLCPLILIVPQHVPGQRIFGGNETGQVVCGGPFAGLGQLAGLGHELVGLGQGGLLEEPEPVGAFFPLREVILVHRPAAKLGGDDLPDFGNGVEPEDDAPAFFAVAQTAVEFLPNEMGQPGDFTVWGDVHRSYLVVFGRI